MRLARGIQYRDKLLEPFHTTSSQGTGLGLYITRELCEANQARIQYVPGDRGSGFRALRYRLKKLGID